MSWVNLVVSLATVAVTLAAVFAAARWKEKADDRAWRRQQRMEAYRDLLVEVDRVIEFAVTVAIPRNLPTDKERLNQLLTSAHSLDRAATRVGLVGSPTLAKLAHEMVKVTFEDVIWTTAQEMRGQGQKPNWEQATEKLMEQYQRFRALARVDLGTDQQTQDIPTARAVVSEMRLLDELEGQVNSNHPEIP